MTIPTRLKIIQGTASKSDKDDYAAFNFTQVSPDAFPEPPTILNADGVQLWNTFGKELAQNGILTIIDLYALTQLAYRWQRHLRKAKGEIDIMAAEDTVLRS